MAARLSGEARKAKAQEAYRMHVARVPFVQISQAIGVGKNMVGTLVKEHAAIRRDEREDIGEREQAIATYDSAIEICRQRLARTQDNSLNVSGLLNAIISAQKAIDDITGIKAVDGIGQNNSAAISNFQLGIEAASKVYLELEEQSAIEE